LRKKRKKKSFPPLQKRKKIGIQPQKSIVHQKYQAGAFSTASQFRPLMEGSSGSNLNSRRKNGSELHVPTEVTGTQLRQRTH